MARPALLRRAAAWLVLLASLAGGAVAEPLVLAAASTARAVDAAIAASGVEALTSFAASGTLARQIEQGAPADLFISANPAWMDHLVDQGLVEAAAVRSLMSNRLVVIAPDGSETTAPDGLVAALGGGDFAMADPAVAPVGRYGQAALEALGLWPAVAPKLLPTRNTVATMAAVARGEAVLGLVYASDAAGVQGVEVLWQIPADSHPPIRYLIAPVASGADPEGAAALLAHFTGAEGQAAFADAGFLPVEGP